MANGRKKFTLNNLDLNEKSNEQIHFETMTDTIIQNVKETNDANTIYYANPNEFVEYDNKRIKLDLHKDEPKERLKESIEKNGIMQPIIVTEINGKKMILSGHNRVAIAKELGINVPYILKNNLSEQERDLIAIDTNLLNRQLKDYKPSQLAYVLHIKYLSDGYKRNPDGESTSVKLSKQYQLSRAQINNYKRLFLLNDNILDAIDQGEMTIKLGVNLSYFTPGLQKEIFSYYSNKNEYKIKDINLLELRKITDSIDENVAVEIISKYFNEHCKINLVKKSNNKYTMFAKYIPPEFNDKQATEYIMKALEAYQKN